MPEDTPFLDVQGRHPDDVHQRFMAAAYPGAVANSTHGLPERFKGVSLELADNIVFSRNRVAGFVGTARLRHGLNILFFKKNLLMQFFQIVAGFHGISFLGWKVILVRPS